MSAARRPLLAPPGEFLFRYRNYLFPLALPLVFLPGPKVLPTALGAALLGLAVALLGQAVRVGTIGLEYIIRGGRDRRVYAETLVTDGIYAHVRNPMYVGNLLIILGVCITANSWGVLAAAVPLFSMAYLAITVAEEEYLAREFGAGYRDYAARVPRFLPRWSGLPATLRNSRLHWRRILTKEYGTLVGWPLRWMVVYLWSLWRDGQGEAVTEVLPALGMALATLALFYVTIRTLKKRRQLVAD